MLDRDRLAKVLALTTSDQDGEVLAAISTANAILKREKMTWNDLLAPPPQSVSITLHRHRAPEGAYKSDENWSPPHLSDKVLIDTMFRAIYSQPRTGNEDFWRWLDDVHNKFEVYGRLTPGQYTALMKCYRRAVRGA